MDNRLVYVEPKALDVVMNELLEGLHAIKRKSKIQNWDIEHVLAALQEKRAGLYLCSVDGKYQGFLVLQRIQEPAYWNLHIWCAYNAGRIDLIQVFFSHIKDLARALGCKNITLKSTRRWSRRLKTYGFQESYTEVYLEI